MQSKYYFIHSLLILGLLIAIGVFVSLPQRPISPTTPPISLSVATTTAPIPDTPVVTHTSSSVPTTTSTIVIPTRVTFIVGTSTYDLPIYENETLIDAMRILASQQDHFSFEGREYPGIGFFVTTINGTAAHDGSNWMLYVDGKPSDVGASQLIINRYSIIEWKYEK